jgi:hypothetical protein
VTWLPPANLTALMAAQGRALSRAQALEHGVPLGRIRGLLRSDRWQSPVQGVYVGFSGPCPPLTRVWVALLHCGPGAVAAGRTAGWLWGLEDELPPQLEVMVPAQRRVRSPSWIAVRRNPSLAERRHPVAVPPRTRLEDTVLDIVTRSEQAGEVIDVLTRACQRRLTTAERLAEAATARARLRWRALLMGVLADLDDGVRSELERRWAHHVERAHGLPAGARNVPRHVGRRRVYRDIEYDAWALVAELDGSAAHPAQTRHLDRARDRWLAVRGVLTLRFGWHEVAHAPCHTAGEVGAALRERGWDGSVTPCGPGCPAPAIAAQSA